MRFHQAKETLRPYIRDKVFIPTDEYEELLQLTPLKTPVRELLKEYNFKESKNGWKKVPEVPEKIMVGEYFIRVDPEDDYSEEYLVTNSNGRTVRLCGGDFETLLNALFIDIQHVEKNE